ncbi:head-tail joining protein [Marilutibacter spongiae]|uniref:Head-tail adaptor protein n=1 Tax=Marilutibacter spongiae TaxID=2025720 RepID=A0A7W3TP44_9GAMM|nr:hypothetical protein [Lysobacter spongiae]MBB1061885.1 hypothetical protein [Lysobacter spongiae]
MLDPAFTDMDDSLFEVFGVDGTVQRGLDVAVPVRLIIDEGVARLGDHGQKIGQVTVASFKVPQWRPKVGDLVTIDGVARKVDDVDSDDGYVARVVLLG